MAVSLLILAGCASDSNPEQSAETLPAVVTGDQAVMGDMVEQAQMSQLREVQERLARLGYKPGNSDGVLGPKTARAIRYYQSDRGLPPDGLVSQGLLRHLEDSLTERPYQPATWLPSRLPAADYQVGDSFVYSNGRIDTVIAVQGERVSWRSNQDTVFETYRNFALPWLAWRTPAERGLRRVRADPDLLWPLQLGETRSFTTARFVRTGNRPDNRYETKESWHCAAEGRSRIALVVGTFDTISIACERDATESQPRHKRIWYYAPRLRHYVRVVDLDETSEAVQQVDLIAMQTTGLDWPPIVRNGLQQTLEKALRTLPKGDSAYWESSAIGAQLTIQPADHTLEFAGARCRGLLQILSKDGKHRVYPGLACRETKGPWQVLGFRQREPLLEAIARGRAP